ncbi:hypothetical protein STEG23_020906 [Scotinomys teguina]
MGSGVQCMGTAIERIGLSMDRMVPTGMGAGLEHMGPVMNHMATGLERMSAKNLERMGLERMGPNSLERMGLERMGANNLERMGPAMGPALGQALRKWAWPWVALEVLALTELLRWNRATLEEASQVPLAELEAMHLE